MGLAWDLWGVHVPCMSRAWSIWPMKWDGIVMGQKIPPDLSQAGWVDKTYKTDCDEKKSVLCYMLKLFLNHSM